MEIITAPVATRFAQLKPGELFIFPHHAGSCVALAVGDPTDVGVTLALPLGPTLPPGMAQPTLVAPESMTVISFGTDYVLRLPCVASGWVLAEPSPDISSILLADGDTYLRANFAARSHGFRPCYIDIKRGEIQADQARREYTIPNGIKAFAIEWEILTIERKARVILQCGGAKN